MSLKRYINNLSDWKRILIQKVKEIDTNGSLIELIQTKQDTIIASNESKSATTSGGVWIFINSKGTILVEGHNPDFGIIKEIHSRRAEIFGLLSALIFLEEYCRYYFIKCQSNIKYHCDNLEVVNKVKDIQREKIIFNKTHKTIDHDAVLVLKELIPRKMTNNHVKSHAEKRKKKE